MGNPAVDLCDVLVDACVRDGRPPPDTAELARLRRTARRIAAAYDRASASADLAEIWPVLADALSDSRDTLLAWMDLLEEIVQLAEQRYGSERGRGRFKAAQVKAAVRRLINESGSPSRDVVFSTLGPSAIDLVVDVVLTLIVALLNRRSNVLWTGPRVPTEALRPVRPPLRQRVLLVLARWFSIVYVWFEKREPLDRELYDEVARIASVRADPLSLLDRVVEGARWVGANRTTVEALMDIVATACDEAEHFSGLPGPAKQRYARNLILIVLDEEFGIRFGSASLVVVEAVIDFLIDWIVSVNNRHGAYRKD